MLQVQKSMKWDGVVLTACSREQKLAVEAQISALADFKEYSEEYFTFEDEPSNLRIGSGGATLLALERLHKHFGSTVFEKRILIIHSGGLSQRLPSASALGKVFLFFPNGKTFLEMKLISYMPILRSVKSGVVIAASDTLEYIPSDIKVPFAEVVVFAHPSSVTVSLQHGVYVVLGSRLITVLQKPSVEELVKHGLLEEGMADDSGGGDTSSHSETILTDSFFIISSTIARYLTALASCRSVDCEICCYGDFLRALGEFPDLRYLDIGGKLGAWRQHLAKIFCGASCEVVVLPSDSFFHFGTIHELLDHFQLGSQFCTRFSLQPQQVICSTVAPDSKTGDCSVIELCNFECPVSVGSRCIISCCSSIRPLRIPDETITTTISICDLNGQPGFICAMFSIHDDLKAKKANLRWFSIALCNDFPLSLWEIPLFSICATREEALESTLSAIQDAKLGSNVISIASALQLIDVREMIKYRKKLMIADS